MKIDWLKIAKERDSDVANLKNSPEFIKYVEDSFKREFKTWSKKDMTIGEARVRTEFNPSKITSVDTIKQYTARLIDLCENLKGKDVRLASLAQTAYEEAAMWAVKAATSETPID